MSSEHIVICIVYLPRVKRNITLKYSLNDEIRLFYHYFHLQ